MNPLAAAVLIGYATFYAPGVMEATANYRGLSCPDCIGYAAMVDPEWIGQRIWIGRPGQRSEGPFLVVDCGKAEHREGQRRRGLVAEVDFATARRWNMRGPVVVRVSITGPTAGPIP
jgi:hypothetical protein